MYKIIILFTVLLGMTSPLWAALQTDTHTYILSERKNSVLAINRQTGQETKIPVGNKSKSMAIRGVWGYVVDQESNTVSVINLSTHQVTQNIAVGRHPDSIAIRGDFGYVMNQFSHTLSVIDLNANTVVNTIAYEDLDQHRSFMIHGDFGYITPPGSLQIIDLKTNTDVKTIDISNEPSSFYIHGEFGYLLKQEMGSIDVMDLNDNNIITTISLPDSEPSKVLFRDSLGYVLSNWSSTLTVIDLESTTVLKTIKTVDYPSSMAIHGDVAYVWSSNEIAVVDLNKGELITELPLAYCKSMVIHGDAGYITQDYDHCDSCDGEEDQTVHATKVLDLKTNKILKDIKNERSEKIDFSDTHVYVGLKKSGFLYPTITFVKRMIQQNNLGALVAMMPDVFNVGDFQKRLVPESSSFDLLPVYVFVDEFSAKLLASDVLSILETMQDPLKIVNSAPGMVTLMPRLYTEFFQAVWRGDKELAHKMLLSFVRIQDHVISPLATYSFKERKGKKVTVNDDES